MAELNVLLDYLNEYLRVSEVPDFPGAYNGLQVEGDGRPIERVATAVDASQATIDAAVAWGAQLLIVHHGLFWDGGVPLTGRRYRRAKTAMDANLAIYSSHLPLDVHAEIGNNAILARELGIEVEGRFGVYKGEELGVWGTLRIGREALAARLDELLGGRIHVVPGGPERIERVGVITGGAASELGAARAAGLDAFVTGEGAHHNYFDAAEGGINLYLGGHYATEIWGVRALGEQLAERFGVESEFIDRPTGL